MDYSELKTRALSIADRSDADTVNVVDTFFLFVESKINRVLRDQKMTIRAKTQIIENQEYYTVPSGYRAMKSIKLISSNSTSGGGIPLSLANIEQITNCIENQSGSALYNVSGDTIRIYPVLKDHYIEMTYYGDISPLSETNPNNWMSINNPDCYIYGLVAEINAFVKDAEAAALWYKRFSDTLQDIKDMDQESTFSGNPLQMRLG